MYLSFSDTFAAAMVCGCFARPAVLEDEVSQLSHSEQSKARRRKSHDSAFEAQLVRLAAKSSGSLQDANDWGDAPGSRRASFCRCVHQQRHKPMRVILACS